MKIYKYPLIIISEQTIELPYGSEVLSVQMQNDNLQMWVRFDPAFESKVQATIVMVQTGEDFIYGNYSKSDGQELWKLVYIDTVQIWHSPSNPNGIVFHVFLKQYARLPSVTPQKGN